MKPTLLYLLLSIFFLSCNNSSRQEEQVKMTNLEQHEAVLTDSMDLNQGEKWKSDAVTNENITSFQSIAEQTKYIKAPGLNEYNQAGSRMQKQLDKLVSECRMKGADHEALHKWLTPLFKSVNALVKTKDKSEAANLIDEIYSHVNSFPKYFK